MLKVKPTKSIGVVTMTEFIKFSYESAKSCSLIVLSALVMVIWNYTGVSPFANAIGTIGFTSFFAFLYILGNRASYAEIFSIWLNIQAVIQLYFWHYSLTTSLIWLSCIIILLAVILDLIVFAIFVITDEVEE